MRPPALVELDPAVGLAGADLAGAAAALAAAGGNGELHRERLPDRVVDSAAAALEAVEPPALLLAVPDRDRAVWATAIYAGLRRGEIMALRWENVDLKPGTLDVVRSWDPEHGLGPTKNRNCRRVPIAAALREQLAAQRLGQPPGIDLCFGIDHGRPSAPTASSSAPTRRGQAWIARRSTTTATRSRGSRSPRA